VPSFEEIQEGSSLKIDLDLKTVAEMLYNEKIFEKVNTFINTQLKNKKNQRAILHSLSRCYMAKPKEPWAYCEQIMQVENGNYNERDHIKSN